MIFVIGFVTWLLGGFFGRVFKETRNYSWMWGCVLVALSGFVMMLYSLLSLASTFLP